MEKLELKHLAPYLPYGLRVDVHYGFIMNMTWKRNIPTNDTENISVEGVLEDLHVKPILRPLSNLTKEIEHNGQKFVPIDFINGEFASTIPRKIEWNQSVKNQNLHFVLSEWISPEDLYGLFELLFKWHFDIFGLIEKGLAVDINTLPE